MKHEIKESAALNGESSDRTGTRAGAGAGIGSGIRAGEMIEKRR
mgnify:CR=1 FL=1|jgi:hypothetical protein